MRGTDWYECSTCVCESALDETRVLSATTGVDLSPGGVDADLRSPHVPASMQMDRSCTRPVTVGCQTASGTHFRTARLMHLAPW